MDHGVGSLEKFVWRFVISLAVLNQEYSFKLGERFWVASSA